MRPISSIEKGKSNLLMQYVDMERRIRDMHRMTSNLGVNGAVISGTFCNECFQDYPCATIRKGIDNEQDD